MNGSAMYAVYMRDAKAVVMSSVVMGSKDGLCCIETSSFIIIDVMGAMLFFRNELFNDYEFVGCIR